MKRIVFVALTAALACTHRVNLNQAPPTADAFHIACATGPCLRAFTTSGVPGGGVEVTRNGMVLYEGPQHFDYSAAADSAGKVTVTFTAQPVTDGDLIVLRYRAGVQPPQPPSQNVQFVKADTTTQGTWIGVYGADGYYLAGDATQPPTYGAASIAGQQLVTWAFATGDVRALQRPSSSERIGAAWSSATTFTIDVNLPDGNSHQLAIYAVDYDRTGRTQRVEVLDASNAVADTRDQTPGEGQYLVWNVRGHVTVRVTSVTGGSAVAAGVFLR